MKYKDYRNMYNKIKRKSHTINKNSSIIKAMQNYFGKPSIKSLEKIMKRHLSKIKLVLMG